MNIYK